VIKVVWGSDWDALFARDRTARCARVRADGRRPVPDLRAKDGALQPRALLRPESRARGARCNDDEEIDRLRRGGHDVRKMHAAYSKGA
jgi:pyruvate dehydrogenase E1 component